MADFEQDPFDEIEPELRNFMNAIVGSEDGVGVIAFISMSDEARAWRMMYPDVSFLVKTDEKCNDPECSCRGESYAVERITFSSSLN